MLLEIMGGRAGEAQTAAFLSALRVKGETAAEIVGMARAMSELAEKVDVDADVILDTCGTGGDAAGTFNISTAAALVAAGRRRHRGQARQPLGDQQVRQRRRPRGARRRHRPRPRAGEPLHRRVRHRLHVRAAPPPGDEARRAGAPRARHGDDVQPHRPAHQPGRRAAPAHRRRRRALCGPHRPGGAHDGQRPQPDRPQRRRPRRDLDDLRDRGRRGLRRPGLRRALRR